MPNCLFAAFIPFARHDINSVLESLSFSPPDLRFNHFIKQDSYIESRMASFNGDKLSFVFWSKISFAFDIELTPIIMSDDKVRDVMTRPDIRDFLRFVSMFHLRFLKLSGYLALELITCFLIIYYLTR